jgi:hypothetical protein
MTVAAIVVPAAMLAVVATLSCCSNTTLKSLYFSRIFHSLFSRHNRKLEDGRLVEGGNVVIRAGGDKGADLSWIPGLGERRTV